MDNTGTTSDATVIIIDKRPPQTASEDTSEKKPITNPPALIIEIH